MRNFFNKYCIKLTGLFLTMSLALLGCGKDDANSHNFGQGARGMSDNRTSQMSAAIPVQVASVKRGDISMFLLQTTTIEAERQVDIITKVAGQVVKLPAEEGVKVKKGDLLAQLDEAELQIEFLQAKVGMETDKATFERAKKMLEKNLIAEENYETTRLQYESSKASYEAARLKLEYTSVRSPIDGVVTARNIELGQRVNVNDALFQVADFNPLRAKIYVPEKDMGRIFEGQQAKITIESEPGLEFSGVVKMISPVVDPTSGTAKVTIDIKDDQGKLKPGMFASVFISTETHKNTLIIPKKALVLESEADQVYVYENGNAHKANLKLGFTSGDNVEVLSGLKEGDLVVTVGQEGLREGLPIRIPDQDQTLTRSTKDTTAATELAANRSGQRRQSRRMGAHGTPDLERLKRMEDRLLQIPAVRKEYEKRLKEDPDMKNNPQKKMAFFREMFQKMREMQ
ncbi:MAG: efflux RND transporter periplasmic adaptor subunit [bacterium]